MKGADRRRARRRRRDPPRRARARRLPHVPPRGRRGARGHPRHQGARGTGVPDPGRCDRGRAERACRSASPSAAARGSPRPRSGAPPTARSRTAGVNAITTMARFLLRLPEALPDIATRSAVRPTVNAGAHRGRAARRTWCRTGAASTSTGASCPGRRRPRRCSRPFRAVDRGPPLAPPRDRAHGRDPRLDACGGDGAGQRRSPCSRARRPARRPARPPATSGFTGITDARFYINDASIPTVIWGPGSLSVAHAADEWVGVDGARRRRPGSYARVFVAFLGA